MLPDKAYMDPMGELCESNSQHFSDQNLLRQKKRTRHSQRSDLFFRDLRCHNVVPPNVTNGFINPIKYGYKYHKPQLLEL